MPREKASEVPLQPIGNGQGEQHPATSGSLNQQNVTTTVYSS